MDIYEAVNQMKIERKTIHDLPLKVTFYARVSTMKDEQDSSIENQIEHFTKLIKDNTNWTFIEGYVDRIRGESAKNRTNFLRMIEDAKNNKFDLILTKEISRFARDTIDGLTYTKDLLRYGVGVLFESDNLCTIDSDSDFRLTVMLGIATEEVRKLSTRVKFARKLAISKDHVLGNSRIYGYNLIDNKLVIDREQAEMVKFIFELYSECGSTRQVERALFDKGYRSLTGNRIHHNTVSNILQNPKYKGWYCGNKVKIVDYRTKEQKFLPEEEWVMHKDETGEIVPAIVSEELWDKCNAMWKQRSAIVKSREHSFKSPSVLSGKIICMHDNKAYWRTSYSNSISKGKPVYEWICSQKKRINSAACPSFAIMEKELYKMLSEYFKKMLPNINEYIEEFLELFRKINKHNDTKSHVEEISYKIDQLKLKQNKLLDMYLDELIDKSSFDEKNKKLKQEILKCNEELEYLKINQDDTQLYINNLKKIEEYIISMHSDVEQDMKDADIDEFIQALINRIEVTAIDKTTLKINVVLKSNLGGSNNVSINYQRKRTHTFSNDSNSCSGNTVFTMLPKQLFTYPRNNRRHSNYVINLNYIVICSIDMTHFVK